MVGLLFLNFICLFAILPLRCLRSYCSVRSRSRMMRGSVPEKSATVPAYSFESAKKRTKNKSKLENGWIGLTDWQKEMIYILNWFQAALQQKERTNWASNAIIFGFFFKRRMSAHPSTLWRLWTKLPITRSSTEKKKTKGRLHVNKVHCIPSSGSGTNEWGSLCISALVLALKKWVFLSLAMWLIKFNMSSCWKFLSLFTLARWHLIHREN